MNKVFKVIWSEARNAYVVVSEIAKNHGSKSCSTKKLLTMLIATGVMTCASMAPAMADNPAPNDKNIAIGSGASTNTYNYNNVYGDKPITGDIAIGQKAYAWNGGYNEGQDIYIGTHEYYMDFGQGGIVLDHSTWRKAYYKVVDGSKVAGSIAIGKNSVARTGSTILGDHTYNGKIGDTEIKSNTNYMNIQPAVFSTTIGSNTYNAGTLATVTGAFSIASSQFNGSGNTNTVTYGAQNTGATIYGSMNSIESATSNDWRTKGYSGVASSVLGFANRTQNANAALIWGTGNEVTNSIEAVTGVDFTKWNSMSVSEAQKDAIKAMQSNQYAGGSVLAIGGGNKADYATYSELTGVQNKVTGTAEDGAKYDLVNGYQNTVENASHVTVIGIKNEVTADGNKVIGDNHQVSGKDNVIIGSADELTETTVNDAVVLGHNAKVTGEGGVALGAGSVASTAAGERGYGADGKTDATWQATKGAVSVGGNGATRQITNVAAGTADTDAVNVAQLKAATENAGWNLSTGKEITNPTKVKSGAIVDFSGDDENITVSKEETDFATLVNVKLNRNLNVDSVQAGDYFMNSNMGIGFGGEAYITQSGLNANDKVITNVAAGVYNTDAVNVGQLKEVEEVAANANKGWNLSTNGVATEATNVAPGEYVDFSGDKNISVSHDGTKVQVELNKDLVGIETISNGDAKLTLGGLATELTNGQGASVKLFGDATIINGKVNVYNDGRIAGVAAGINDTDAVNVSQLKNSAWKLAANGVLTEAEDVKAGDYVDFSGDQNVSVSKDAKDGVKTVKVELNKDLVGIETISNDGASLTLNGTATELTNGKGAAITLFGDTTTINNKVTVYNDGRISGVAAGINDTDAVNVSQLKAVGTTANMGWNLATNGVATEATNVKPGDFVDFSGDKNISVSHDGTKVQVKLNENIDVNSVQTNALNSKYNLSVGTMAENGIMPFFVNSTGDFYAAHNKFHVDKDGKVTATAGEIGNVVLQNGVYYGHSALRDGELFVGDASGNYSQITTKGAKLGKVTVAEDGKISGVAAGAITADSTDAVNGSQLHAVATEAGKHSKVVNGSNINVEEFDNDGQKIYKVNLNKDIMLGDLTGKYVNISGTNGTIETTGYIATKDRVYADKGAKLADIDVTGDKISNGASSIVLDGSNVKVNDKVTIDQNGNIAGVNSIQTNALNAKYNLSVGTANENGIMPFFVNSNGAFYGANNNFSVDKDGKVTATAGEIGNVVLQNGVYTGHSALRDGELFVGDASGNYSQITTKGAKLGKVTVAEDGKISGVAAGAVTADSTDAVNGSQLHAVATEAGKHSKVVNGSNINVEETDVDGQKIYKVNLNKDIMLGDLTGKYVNISGTNGTIETTGYIATKDRVYADKGAKLADIDVTGDKISNGASSIVLDGSNVKVNDKVTIDQNGKISGVAAGEISKTSTDAINGSQLNQTNENVAALDKRVTDNEAAIKKNQAAIEKNANDIATNKANIEKNANDIATNKANIEKNAADISKLDTRVTNVEALAKKHTTVTAGDNITVTEDTNKDGGKEYKVALSKDITVDSVKAGDTTITDKGLEIKDGPSVTKDGIYAGDKKITGVAKGEADTDAVNYGQLKDTNNHIDRVENQVVNNTNRINKLGSRVNKVGAGAAALAALHPMDFDPDDKLTFSAGYGNYGGENAAAIGAYYRPDEKVMFSVAGTVGNGENMVNAGVSFALDRTNHVSNSRTALAREVIDLRGQLAVMGAKMAKMEKAFGMLDETKTKLFPDVPANHWAYEYIAKLAGNGYIEGYPDGNFGGDRLMTRYEFAAMLYRAIENGAALEEKIIKEFEPELGRIRVDRISGEDGDRDKIERVRVNDTKGERDHYGNKLAK